MKQSTFFIEVTRAKTPMRRCHSCNELIPENAKYLHMKRNKHLFNLCGKCMVLYGVSVTAEDVAPKIVRTATHLHTCCHSCRNTIEKDSKHLYLKRNKHTFILCGNCMSIYTTKVLAHDKTHKADAMAEIL